MEKQIIDGHLHLFSEKVKKDRAVYLEDEHFKIMYTNEKAKIATASDILSYMALDNIGMSFCLGFPWIRSDFCRHENDKILEETSEKRKSMIPFGTVALDSKTPYADTISLASMGFAGIGELGFYRDGFGPKQQEFLRQIFQACSEKDLCVVLHVNEPVGHVYTGKYHTDYNLLIQIISEYPTVRLMLAHWGGGFFIYEAMPEIRKTLSNVWYDTAASPYIYDESIYVTAQNIIENKIVFGSDFPLLGRKKYDSGIEKFGEDVLNKNALDFLGSSAVNK